MSRAEQGRQYHGRFGSGTSGVEAAPGAPHIPDDHAATVVFGAATASLQAMAQEIATSGDMDAADRHLAAAVMDGGRADAIYRFAGAQYRAAYAEVNGLLPDGPAKAEGPSEAVPDKRSCSLLPVI